MRNVLLHSAMKLIKNHKQRKWWQRTVRVMGTAVVFCTTYALILPAITMEHEAICGLEAHEHVETCYTQQVHSQLVCGIGEGVTVVHSHDTLCRDNQGNLICPLSEIKEHIHGDSCFSRAQVPACAYVHVHSDACISTRSVLVCGLEETAGHTHSEACTTRTVQICEMPESEGHTHSESCGSTEQVLICTEPAETEHVHGEGCYETKQIPCELAESEGHTHGEGCYEIQQISCPLTEQTAHAHTEACYAEREVPCELTTNDGHVHEDACYPRQLVCEEAEIILHSHDDVSCRDADGALVCTLPEVQNHVHTEGCLTQTQEKTLDCKLEEHIHVDSCYPEEETKQDSQYICGMGIHAHTVACTDGAGNLLCTIPEHTHEAACLVADLDLTADTETAQDWQDMTDELVLTGSWPTDLVTVATAQIGYRESEKNVVLVDDALKGYTRYGAWAGDPYGDWNESFVSFCLHHAGIRDFSTEDSCESWIEKLTEDECYASPEEYTPKTGDLVFYAGKQSAAGEEALSSTPDRVAIVAELIPATEEEPAKLRTIAGDVDGAVREVTFDRADPAIMGYGILPENPMPQEQWAQAMQVKTLVAELPNVETVRETFQSLQEQRDKAGHEALRQELMSRLDAIYSLYETFTDSQKELTGSIEPADALKELCGGETWQEYPALAEDGAMVTSLVCGETSVIPVPTEAAETAAAETAAETAPPLVIPEMSIQDGDTVVYGFTVEAGSYYSDVRYGEARAKVELVLPLTKDKAQFDTAAMTWLEESVLKFERRAIGDKPSICQVLTGYVSLAPDEQGIAVPGIFAGEIPVKVRNMNHGEKLKVIISAAMEFGTWDGPCAVHGTEELLSVSTEEYALYDPLSAEEQNVIYQNYRSQIESIASLELPLEEQAPLAQLLLEQVVESYGQGGLSDSEMEELGDSLRELLGMYAEYATGIGWMLDDEPAVLSAAPFMAARSYSLASMPALSSELYNTVFASTKQVERVGGYNPVTEDGEMDNSAPVAVGKHISGTEIENVFDITLEVVTKDTVNSVYEDPDMAVVVVMDISETMNSKFPATQTKTSRYDAAMNAGEDFLYQFAEAVADNKGLSKVGYVAFNTHSHKVFDLSNCSTAAEARDLNTTMRNETKSIMNKAAAAAEKGLYANSHERFTNMQAGLQMAADMLAGANNEHKYIIFISDGFPTTYLQSSYRASSDKYVGYDPYTSGGTEGKDGVFYDSVRDVHCDYGTSYSDTAAIKARQLAVSLKGQGVNIFSIGVDVAGQTIKYYHDSYYNDQGVAKGFSIVERREEENYYNSTGYEIGTLHSEITVENPTAAQKAAMAQDFKDWLKGTASSGIGSGYYYDSSNTAELEKAYDSIFQEIEKINAESAHLDWVATDPMPDMGVHELETMEFIGFYDQDGNLVTGTTNANGVFEIKLVGSSEEGAENTADYHFADDYIHWDLKKSGFTSRTVGNVTNYYCSLKYRVRLKNENEGFSEKIVGSDGTVTAGVYDTNDRTFLTYRIIEVVDNITQVSDSETIEFPIPAVHGYLSELNFMKTDLADAPLAGAEFTLTHDPACNVCRGDGKSAVELEVMTESSGADGMVTFTNIPSGHKYILEETKAPIGFIKTQNTYHVEIAYDALTVTVTDKDGQPLTWDSTVENEMYYELPSTGGRGTSPFTFGGLLLIAAACVYYVNQFGRKRQKGGAGRSR